MPSRPFDSPRRDLASTPLAVHRPTTAAKSTQHPPTFVVPRRTDPDGFGTTDPFDRRARMQGWERGMARKDWSHWKGHINARDANVKIGTNVASPTRHQSLSQETEAWSVDAGRNGAPSPRMKRPASWVHSETEPLLTGHGRGTQTASTEMKRSHLSVGFQYSLLPSESSSATRVIFSPKVSLSPSSTLVPESRPTSGTDWNWLEGHEDVPSLRPVEHHTYLYKLGQIKRLIALSKVTALTGIGASSPNSQSRPRGRPSSAPPSQTTKPHPNLPIRSYTPVYIPPPRSPSPKPRPHFFRPSPIDMPFSWPHESPSPHITHPLPCVPPDQHDDTYPYNPWEGTPGFMEPTEAWEKKVEARQQADGRREALEENVGFGSGVRRFEVEMVHDAVQDDDDSPEGADDLNDVAGDMHPYHTASTLPPTTHVSRLTSPLLRAPLSHLPPYPSAPPRPIRRYVGGTEAVQRAREVVARWMTEQVGEIGGGGRQEFRERVESAWRQLRNERLP